MAVRQHGMPGSLPPAGGDAVTVAGLPARRVSGPADAACREIGGSDLVQVVLPPAPGASGWMSLDACLAGGDATAARAAFDAILGSVTFVEPTGSG